MNVGAGRTINNLLPAVKNSRNNDEVDGDDHGDDKTPNNHVVVAATIPNSNGSTTKDGLPILATATTQPPTSKLNSNPFGKTSAVFINYQAAAFSTLWSSVNQQSVCSDHETTTKLLDSDTLKKDDATFPACTTADRAAAVDDTTATDTAATNNTANHSNDDQAASDCDVATTETAKLLNLIQILQDDVKAMQTNISNTNRLHTLEMKEFKHKNTVLQMKVNNSAAAAAASPSSIAAAAAKQDTTAPPPSSTTATSPLAKVIFQPCNSINRRSVSVNVRSGSPSSPRRCSSVIGSRYNNASWKQNTSTTAAACPATTRSHSVATHSSSTNDDDDMNSCISTNIEKNMEVWRSNTNNFQGLAQHVQQLETNLQAQKQQIKEQNRQIKAWKSSTKTVGIRLENNDDTKMIEGIVAAMLQKQIREHQLVTEMDVVTNVVLVEQQRYSKTVAEQKHFITTIVQQSLEEHTNNKNARQQQQNEVKDKYHVDDEEVHDDVAEITAFKQQHDSDMKRLQEQIDTLSMTIQSRTNDIAIIKNKATSEVQSTDRAAAAVDSALGAASATSMDTIAMIEEQVIQKLHNFEARIMSNLPFQQQRQDCTGSNKAKETVVVSSSPMDICGNRRSASGKIGPVQRNVSTVMSATSAMTGSVGDNGQGVKPDNNNNTDENGEAAGEETKMLLQVWDKQLAEVLEYIDDTFTTHKKIMTQMRMDFLVDTADKSKSNEAENSRLSVAALNNKQDNEYLSTKTNESVIDITDNHSIAATVGTSRSTTIAEKNINGSNNKKPILVASSETSATVVAVAVDNSATNASIDERVRSLVNERVEAQLEHWKKEIEELATSIRDQATELKQTQHQHLEYSTALQQKVANFDKEAGFNIVQECRNASERVNTQFLDEVKKQQSSIRRNVQDGCVQQQTALHESQHQWKTLDRRMLDQNSLMEELKAMVWEALEQRDLAHIETRNMRQRYDELRCQYNEVTSTVSNSRKNKQRLVVNVNDSGDGSRSSCSGSAPCHSPISPTRSSDVGAGGRHQRHKLHDFLQQSTMDVASKQKNRRLQLETREET